MSHSGNFNIEISVEYSAHRKLQKIKDSKRKEKVNLENLQIGEEIAQRRPHYNISCIWTLCGFQSC